VADAAAAGASAPPIAPAPNPESDSSPRLAPLGMWADENGADKEDENGEA
jgi:hypothetical protein